LVVRFAFVRRHSMAHVAQRVTILKYSLYLRLLFDLHLILERRRL
jgi:hypothetical protein